MASKFEQRLEELKRKYSGGGGTPDKVPAPSTSSTPAPSQGGVGDVQAKMLKRLGITAPAAPAQTPALDVPKVEPVKISTEQRFDESPNLVVEMPDLPKYKPPQYLSEKTAQAAKEITPSTVSEFKQYQKTQEMKLADRYSLAIDIGKGKVKVTELEPDQIPWDQLFSQPMYGQIAAVGMKDPAKAYPLLVEMQGKLTGTAQDKQSILPPSFGAGFAEGAAESASFGVSQMAPGRTTAEKAGQFVGQVAGALPGVLAAASTGGAAAGGLATRVAPQLGKSLAGRMLASGIAAAGTGATYQAAREGAQAVARPEEADLKRSAQNIASTTGTYALFGALSPVSSEILGSAGRLIANKVPGGQAMAQSVATAAKQYPTVAKGVEGATEGLLTGGMYGTVMGGVDAVRDPEARSMKAFVQSAAQNAGEEFSENIIEALVLGLAQKWVPVNAKAVVDAGKQIQQAEQTSSPKRDVLAEGLALANELVPSQTMPTASHAPVQQEQVPSPTPAVQTLAVASQTQVEAPKPQGVSKTQRRSQMLRDANHGMDEKAILRLIKDTSNLSDADFATFAQRVGKPESAPKVEIPAPTSNTRSTTESTPEPEFEVEGTPVLSSQVTKPVEKPKSFGETVNVGDKVVVEGRKGVFEVVDTKDPSLLRVKTASGAELPVGRATVKPVEQTATLGQAKVEPLPVERKAAQKEQWQMTRAEFDASWMEQSRRYLEEEVAKKVEVAQSEIGRLSSLIVSDPDNPANATLWASVERLKDDIAKQHERLNASFVAPSTTMSEAQLRHYRGVDEAVKAGEKLPPEVLADYPDLQTKKAPATQQKGEEKTVPPATMAEMKNSLTMTELREKAAQAADTIGTTLERVLRNPQGWKGILTNPSSALHRYWLQEKMQSMGKPLPQKVSDLMVELSSALSDKGNTRASDIKRIQDDLTVAVENALKDEKTFVERLLDGEEAISLTGKALPLGALEGKVVQPSPRKVEPSKAQQTNLFDQGTANQLASFREELNGVQREKTDTQKRWDALVQEISVDLAKKATASNEEQRKAFWQRIKQHGYIGPNRTGGNGDFYGKLPSLVNFLKRKDGTPLDVLATDMGYESEEALIRDIIGFAHVKKVIPNEVRSEAESIVAVTQAGADMKVLLDYYRQAEMDVKTAIAELEGGKYEETGKAQTTRQGRPARSAETAVRGSGTTNRATGTGEGPTTQPQKALKSANDTLRSKADGNTQGFAGVRPSAPTTQSKPFPPVKRKQIVNFLNEKFAPIKTGGVRGWFLGTFNKVTGVIRTKTVEDFPVQMHEVGHRLDQQLGLSANRSFDAELLPMGDPTTPPSKVKDHDYRRAEGVAEFLRLYVMDPTEAQKQAPTYYATFEGIMQANPDVHLNLLEARQMVQRWFSQDPKDKVLGAISVGEGERSTPFSKDRIYQQAIDEFNPLQVIERKVTGGQELSVEESPYKLANLTRGWTGLAETFINHGVVDRDFNKVGEPLSQIMDEVASEDDFRAYIVAKRAQEKMGQGFTPEQLLGIGITEQEIAQVVADLEPQYGKLQQRLVKFQDAVLRQLVDAEVLSQEAANQIRLMNQEYVPFYRLMDPNLGTMSFASTTKFGNLPQPVKRLKGSGRTIVDPLESVIKNTYSILNVAARNRVAVAMDKLAEVTENKGEWWTEVSVPVRPVDFNLETVKKALENQGVDTDSLDLDKVVTIFAPLGKPRAAQSELTFFRNGQRKYVQVNEEVYKAMLGMETDAANTLVKLLSYPASMLRAGAVLDPGFAATNPMRDQLNAYVQSKYGYRPYFDMARGMFNVLGKTDLYWKWVAAGGDQAAMVSMDRDSLQKQLDEHLKKGGIGRVIRRGNPVEFLRTVSAVMENSTRMGEFLRAVESQVQEQGNTPQNRTLSDRFTGRDLASMADRGTLREAALAARDVTTDFSRKGSSVHSLNRVRAFFGATVQGLDKTYRTFRDNPVRTSIRAGITFTLPTILLYLLNRENHWYEEKPEWQKDAFWMVPTDWTNPTQSQHFLYLPKSHLYGQVFGAIPERILRWVDKNDKQAFDNEFAKRTLDQLLPTSANEGFIPIPTAMVPLLEVMTNHDFYTDLPVVPQREQRLEPKDRYSPYTSETAKGIASLIRPVLDTSPRNIDQLISGYGGGLTTTGIEVTESLLAKVGALDRVPKMDRGVAGYPVLKRFLRDAGGPGQGSSVEVYMNAMTKMEQRYASMSPGPEKERMLSAIRPYRKIDDTMADLRALKRDVLASEKLTPQQKREYVDRVDMAITNMARQALGKEPINN